MQLTKHHGLGNDFLVLLDAERSVDLTRDLAVRLCDRRTGVGADGMIRATRPGVDGADVHFELRNSDGSIAEVSGNGLRCLAQAAARRGWLPTDRPSLISTVVGPRTIRFAGAATDDAVDVAVSMGPAGVFDAADDIRHDGAVPKLAASVDLGNPHLVLLVDDLTAIDPAGLGPGYEAQFPAGVNVEWITSDGSGAIDLVVWERGAGVTQACGSGATAAVAAASRWGISRSPVEVRMPGGAVTVEVGPEMVLTGPTVFVATIEVA